MFYKDRNLRAAQMCLNLPRHSSAPDARKEQQFALYEKHLFDKIVIRIYKVRPCVFVSFQFVTSDILTIQIGEKSTLDRKLYKGRRMYRCTNSLPNELTF